MGNWTITVPEAGTNLETDPECTALDFYNGLSSTVTVDTTYARFGHTCLKIVTGNATASEGVFTDNGSSGMPVTAGTAYTFSAYLRGAGTVYLFMDWYDSGGSSTGAGSYSAAIVLANTRWTRYTLTVTAPVSAAYSSTAIYTQTKQNVTFYADGLQFEAKSYATTFMSGNQPGCRWNGLYNASTSSRDTQYRLGGHEVDIETTYGVKINAVQGMGLPQVQNNLQILALQPGAVFQSTKALTRTLDLIVSAQVNLGDAVSTLHTRRDYINSLFGFDQYRGAQPVRLGYTGTGHTVYGEFRYAGGLEFTGMSGRNEKIPLRLLGVNPFWYEDDQGQTALDFTDTIISAGNTVAKIDGTWGKLGSGFSDGVRAIAIDYQRGRVYFGGLFATANGVTVNRVTYWNGSTFVALGGTAGTAGGNGVYALAVAPNGDLWVGGDFTSAGGATADGLARWNVDAGNWTCFTNGTPGDAINALAIDKNGLVYIGGSFANWDGDADEDNITSYNGTNFVQLSTGANGAVNALAIGKDGTTLYVGGDFTSPQTRLMSWNGSAFAALGSGASGSVNTLMVDNDGSLFAGGAFTSTPSTTYIARWDGATWSSLGAGVNDTVYNIGLASSGLIFVSGAFTTAGGLTAAYSAAWNRYSWVFFDLINLGVTKASASLLNDFYIGSGANPSSSGHTTVTNGGSTTAFPIITITGTTTAGASSTLKWLENQSTGQVMYFNLTVQAGETVTIDLSPGKKTITSNWRGRIYDNPLSNSDFANWSLLPGANVIACFMTGTTTGATVIMSWDVQHLSVDGSV